MTTYRSPLLDLPGACPAPEASPDSGVPWHYGDPHGEQRLLDLLKKDPGPTDGAAVTTPLPEPIPAAPQAPGAGA